jgi:hypothetical protein
MLAAARRARLHSASEKAAFVRDYCHLDGQTAAAIELAAEWGGDRNGAFGGLRFAAEGAR